LTFRPLTEAFIRRSWYSVLAVLDMMRGCRVKKAVVGVTELVAALIPIVNVKNMGALKMQDNTMT